MFIWTIVASFVCSSWSTDLPQSLGVLSGCLVVIPTSEDLVYRMHLPPSLKTLACPPVAAQDGVFHGQVSVTPPGDPHLGLNVPPPSISSLVYIKLNGTSERSSSPNIPAGMEAESDDHRRRSSGDDGGSEHEVDPSFALGPPMSET